MKFLSNTKGTGGVIKKYYEDFVVKEITSKGVKLEPGLHCAPKDIGEDEDINSKFSTFILEKRNWDTIKALLAVSKSLGRGKGAFAYCGIKDKTSVSVQLASMHGVEPKDIERVKIKDISINCVWKGGPVELGSNVGNGFVARIRDAKPEYAQETINELNGVFPNYFDKQRFGYRLNNFEVGLHIIKNELEEAILSFLTETKNETDLEAVHARKRLKEDRDYKEAVLYFPKHLRYERMVIEYLSKQENYANAIRRIPRGISIMFIHAVESAIFNAVIDSRIKNTELFNSDIRCGKNKYGFPNIEELSEDGAFPMAPLIGYETKDKYMSEYEKRLLEFLDITKESFKIKSMPELSMKGSLRSIIAPVKDIKTTASENEINVEFSLPSGAYATIFLNEIMKNDGLTLKSVYEKFSSIPL